MLLLLLLFVVVGCCFCTALCVISRALVIFQVSYGATDTLLNYRYFYRNLPSDQFLNEARLILLVKFQWYKVGTLASEDYAKVSMFMLKLN